MKTDARVRYTKLVLRDSLLHFLKTKPIQQITVTEVCERAQINRATFYKHYQNCGDLLAQIENELIADYETTLQYMDAFDGTHLLDAIFDTIHHNLDLYKLLVFDHTDNALIHKMIAVTHDRCIAHWKPLLPKAGDNELELLFTCLANGLLHVVLEGFFRYEQDELIAFVNTIVTSSLAAYQ